jgi:tetratricopeptide (TPR) repeat protein
MLRFSFPELLTFRSSTAPPASPLSSLGQSARTARENPGKEPEASTRVNEPTATASLPGVEVGTSSERPYMESRQLSRFQTDGFAQDRDRAFSEVRQTAHVQAQFLPAPEQVPSALPSAQQPPAMLPPPQLLIPPAPAQAAQPTQTASPAPNPLSPAIVNSPQQAQPAAAPAARPPAQAPTLPRTEPLPAPRQAQAGSEPAPALPAAGQQPKPENLPTPRQVPPVAEPAPDQPQEKQTLEGAALLGLARIAVQRGNFAEAIRRFTEYLKQAPRDTAVRRELAGILVRAGKRQEAVEEYRRLLAEKPDDVETIVALANAYVATREYLQAAAILGQASAKAPNNLALTVQLARVLTYARDFLQAHQLLERVLLAVGPEDERVPVELPSLLLDMQRPADALRYLLKLRERRSKDAVVLADLVRAYAAVADEAQALKALDDLVAAGVGVPERLALADTLLDSGYVIVANAVYGQVLSTNPGNVLAQIGLARVAIYQFLPLPAFKLLQPIHPEEGERRKLQMAWGEYHQLVGQYTEGQVYLDLICNDPLDGEVILARAKLLQLMGDYEKAKAEFAKILPDSSFSRQGRLGIASVLFDQRRYGESIEICEKLLAEQPADGDAAALLIRNLVKAGDCQRAITVGRGFLAAFGRIEPVAVPVQLALGRALLDSGSFAEAAHEFVAVLARPGGRIVSAWYGLSRAQGKVAGLAEGDEPILAAVADPGHETRNRLLLADQFYADNNDRDAIEMAQSVLKHDSKNLAALIRLADSLVRDASPTAQIGPAVDCCKEILALSPTNVRGRLALARAYATAADYCKSVGVYDELIAQDPKYLVPRREKARVLISDHKYGAAAATYDLMLHPTPEQVLQVGLQALLPRFPAIQGALAPLSGGGAEHGLAKEIARVAESISDAATRACLRALILDAEARAAEITVVALEKEAKCDKDWRNLSAVPLYNDLVHKEPNNTDALFDLGQVYGEMKQTHAALESFAQVLAIDPLQREAAIAQERATFELNPRLNVPFGYFNQTGRDGLANIGRLTLGSVITCPYGDENDTVTFGYTRARYIPPGFPDLDGNWLTLGASKQLDPTRVVYGVANIEQYADRVSTRPTFDLGGNWMVCDGYRVARVAFSTMSWRMANRSSRTSSGVDSI